MDILANEIGIDVHKDNLVVSIGGKKSFSVPNQDDEIQKLIPKLPPSSVVHLEASGGYERPVCKLLKKAGITVRVHNPLKARRLFQGLGTNAKTDAVDAKALSQSANLLPAQPQKSLDRQDLADFCRAIRTIKEEIADHRKRIKVPGLDEGTKGFYQEVIKVLLKLVKKREREYHARLQRSAYAQQFTLLQSIPAIGKVTAGICVAELPEDFKNQTAAQICSYAGLAPIDNASGKKNGPAHLGKGNSRLKGAFYMPALTAIGSETWASELYQRLRTKGRTHQQALVPVMRRLLVRVHVVLARETAWKAEPPKHVSPAKLQTSP